MSLPDGRLQNVAALAEGLTLTSPGAKLVYATDFADTAENRRRLTALAANAQVLFCESSFLNQDWIQAERTGHLTARGCGEIAVAAAVPLPDSLPLLPPLRGRTMADV